MMDLTLNIFFYSDIFSRKNFNEKTNKQTNKQINKQIK